MRAAMEALGWTQDDLARILNKSRQAVNDVIQSRSALTPEMAMALGTAFGKPPSYWMDLESAYRLSLVEEDVSVRRRAALYEWAPVKEMERRGWIAKTKSADELERELRVFFATDTLDEVPRVSAATRKSGAAKNEPELTPKQRAWCFRVKQLGEIPPTGRFNENALPKLKRRLRELASYPSETKHVPETLSDFGIRFVVVQPIPGSHIEGVTLWRGDEPIIGISLLHDRVDSFWHTLMHELSHVTHKDELSVDIKLTGEDADPTITKDPIEQRADAEACASLIDPVELRSFMGRVTPYYYKEKVVGFAHRIKIHPCIIVGQLQSRGEIGWYRFKELTPKVRDLITPSAITDGYGNTVDLLKHSGVITNGNNAQEA